jgi:hydroxyethylthiazole kinase-like uncharacterized protein yjeF
MKILSAQQSKEIDQFTIDQQEISSLDLMDRAAYALFNFLEENFAENQGFHVFCGMGNNGGDGLVLARLLHQNNYPIWLSIVQHRDKGSSDFEANLKSLPDNLQPEFINEAKDNREIEKGIIIIDAILGNGLDRPLSGLIAAVVDHLQLLVNFKIAIDIPTGLFADDNSKNDLKRVLATDLCLCIHSPKRSLLNAFTAPLIGNYVSLDIGLSPQFISEMDSDSFFLTKEDIIEIYRPRKKFSYKGSYGHLLQLAGSKNTMGAAHISSEAAMRSGCGLATALVPDSSFASFNIRQPELMLYSQDTEMHKLKGDFTAFLAGPGLSSSKSSGQYLKNMIQAASGPMVLDADALNILAENPTWLRFLTPGTILSPHPGEMRRLLNKKKLDHNYLMEVSTFAQKYKVNVLLKDAISVLVTNEGMFIYSDFATPALAKAGSGDCLSGIIGSLLAQSYTPKAAVCLAIYLHGTAAKLASKESSVESVLASDVILKIGAAFQSISSSDL